MIYFVSENFIKKNSQVTNNIKAETLTPTVELSAKAYVKPMIGSYFFNYLLTKYNDKTLSSDELLVVEKIQYAILWRVNAEAVLTLTYQLKDKGLQKQNDEFAESVELSEATFMYNNYIQYATYFQSELKQFLIDNKDDYPEFLNTLNKDSSVRSLCSCGNTGDWNEGTGFIII